LVYLFSFEDEMLTLDYHLLQWLLYIVSAVVGVFI
jgi:hypothetical protein